MDFVTEAQQIVGQVTPILPRDSGDQRSLGHGGDCSR
jgi:hypothetical protein